MSASSATAGAASSVAGAAAAVGRDAPSGAAGARTDNGTATTGKAAGTAGSAGSAANGGAGRSGTLSAGSGASGLGGASGASSIAANSGGVGGSAGSASASTLPPVASVDMDGPFKTKQDLKSGPKGASGLFQPVELGKDGLKHPIFLFGCGGGSNPSSYATDLSRIATHGFVVLADVSAIGDNATVFKASLDWLIAENGRAGSALYGKLDTTKIAAGGHSIGSVNAFAFGPDPRLTTTLHIAGGSLDNVNNPSAPTTGMGGKMLVHPTAYICDVNDQFGNDTKAETDYKATTAPVFFTLMTGTDHVGIFKVIVPLIVAWLRWHLGGETERRSLFLDPAGQFCKGQYMSMSKNW